MFSYSPKIFLEVKMSTSIYKKIILTLALIVSFDLTAVAADSSYYTKLADSAGAFYSAFAIANKFNKSECPIKINADWTDTSKAKIEILSKFPSVYHKELINTFPLLDVEIDKQWKTTEVSIRKARLAGKSCNEITDKVFWRIFDNSVQNWRLLSNSSSVPSTN